MWQASCVGALLGVGGLLLYGSGILPLGREARHRLYVTSITSVLHSIRGQRVQPVWMKERCKDIMYVNIPVPRVRDRNRSFIAHVRRPSQSTLHLHVEYTGVPYIVLCWH